MNYSSLITGILALLLTQHLGAQESIDEFLDDEGCILCHKYPKMARVTEEGVRRNYTVLPHVYSGTVHRNVSCSDCHKEINQLPHREVVEGVSCDSECHSIKNPATGKNFSHRPIVELYEQSVHARPKIAEGHDKDKPYCVTCHANPLYNPDEDAPPENIVRRCVICHEDQKFVVSWYRHTSRRIREIKRSSEELVALCSTCHGDERLVDRHLKAAREEGRELGKKYPIAVESYLNSFHGKVTRYGFNKAANCLDCHTDKEDYFLNVHYILPSYDPNAPTSNDRKVETCKRCHIYADENYAAFDPHPSSSHSDNPLLYYIEYVYSVMSGVVIVTMIGLATFETIGRRRDGAGWLIQKGSSWRRRSRRGRDRLKK